MTSRTSYDARLRHPGSKIIVCGSSNSGKSTLFVDMVLDHERIFTSKITNVIVFFRENQKEYDRLRQRCKIPLEFIQGEPDDTFDCPAGSMIIFDDMQSMDGNPAIASIFQIKARHRFWSCIMVQHLIFTKAKTSRLITLNSTAIIIFQNRHDKLTLSKFSSQIEGVGMARLLPNLFKDLSRMGNHHSYLLIDLDIECPEVFKYRSSVYPEHGKTIVFIPS